jgi:uncharacterized protein (DUF1919 family)
MKYKFVLWGLGALYNRLFNSIKYFEEIGAIEITAVTDNHFSLGSHIDNYSLVQPKDIVNVEYDYIVILSSKFFNEIRRELIETGADSNRILSYRFLEIPNVNVDKYIQLKNSNLSIVSNNCWGGIIYKTLGLECLSPFKNLYLNDHEYIKLLSRLAYYLSCEPVLYKYIYDDSRNIEYPILRLDDILVYCNHDVDAEEAISKWKRRNKKFNSQNIFVEMYTSSRDIAKEFSELNQYSKKICFVPFQTESPYLMELEMYEKHHAFWETVNSNAAGGANALKYNPVDLLCMEKCIRGA